MLSCEFCDLGGYDQVGRALRHLIEKDLLVSMGYGVYARAKKSTISGKIVPEKTLQELAKEVLKKMHVRTAPSSAEQAYNNGFSTQVPTGRVIGVRERVSRKIGYDGKFISFEKVTSPCPIPINPK